MEIARTLSKIKEETFIKNKILVSFGEAIKNIDSPKPKQE